MQDNNQGGQSADWNQWAQQQKQQAQDLPTDPDMMRSVQMMQQLAQNSNQMNQSAVSQVVGNIMGTKSVSEAQKANPVDTRPPNPTRGRMFPPDSKPPKLPFHGPSGAMHRLMASERAALTIILEEQRKLRELNINEEYEIVRECMDMPEHHISACLLGVMPEVRMQGNQPAVMESIPKMLQVLANDLATREKANNMGLTAIEQAALDVIREDVARTRGLKEIEIIGTKSLLPEMNPAVRGYCLVCMLPSVRWNTAAHKGFKTPEMIKSMDGFLKTVVRSFITRRRKGEGGGNTVNRTAAVVGGGAGVGGPMMAMGNQMQLPSPY